MLLLQTISSLGIFINFVTSKNLLERRANYRAVLTGRQAGRNKQKYCEQDQQHTMCRFDGIVDWCRAVMINNKLTPQAKQEILGLHNDRRSQVALGLQADQPSAANMRELVWSTELENIAQRWADQCSFVHDQVRNKLDFTYVGQSIYILYNTERVGQSAVMNMVEDAVDDWFNEVTDPGFNPHHMVSYKHSPDTGHYTQVVWAETSEIGCGLSYYEEGGFFKNLIVCNYAKGGNEEKASVYKKGAPASQCPTGYRSNIDRGLCVKKEGEDLLAKKT